MNRSALLRLIAEQSTQASPHSAEPQSVSLSATSDAQELFVWFEDTSSRTDSERIGIAGLPECLLPADPELKVLQRHRAFGHPHLLSAVRLLSRRRTADHISAIYTMALAVGTVAWIGTGTQYADAWTELYGDAKA